MKYSGTVYSSEHGRMCPDCGQPLKQCRCSQTKVAPAGDGIVRLGRAKRKGKGVTTISGLPLEGKELTQLAKKLKQLCASGGSIKEGIVEIQGDHREKLQTELKKLGYTVKLAGG